MVVSGNSSLCPQTFGAGTPHGNCNENQFSDPFVGPDGSLYVAYNNFNNSVSGNDNRNQILLSKSTDGGNTFSAPVKVSDYYDLPECDAYQGAGADPFGLCAGEGIVDGFRLPRDELCVGRRQPEEPEPGRGDGRLVHQQGLQGVERLHSGRLRPRHRNQPLHRRQDGRGCNNKILVSVSTTPVRASPERRSIHARR